MKKVLVIGAGFLQSYVIKRAKEIGLYVLAVDGNPNAMGFQFADEFAAVNIIDEKACLEYAKEHKVDGVLTAATDYGVLSAAYVAQELGLPGIKYSSAQRIKNKYQVRKCLYDAKADDTGLAYEISLVEDIENIKNSVQYPVMVKPCDGSGSRGAARVDSEKDFYSACVDALNESLSHKVTVEPFIVGKEYGVESFVENGNIHIMAVMQKDMTEPPYYAELGHAIPSGLPVELENKVRNCVEKALRALEVNHGSVNMDLLITESGNVHIVDVGARMGGNLIGSHLVPIGAGIDYIGNMLKAAVGDECDFTPVRKGVPVASRLLALQPGVVEALPDFDSISADGTIIEHHLSVGDTITPYRTNLDGCGYVVCTAENVADAKAKAIKAKNRIDTEIVRK